MSTRTSSRPYYIYKYFLCPEKKPSIKSSLLRPAQSREVAFSAALLQTVSLAGLARSPGLCGPAGGTLTLSVEQPAATFSQVPHQPQLDPVPSHLRSNNPLTLSGKERSCDFRLFHDGQDVDEIPAALSYTLIID